MKENNHPTKTTTKNKPKKNTPQYKKKQQQKNKNKETNKKTQQKTKTKTKQTACNWGTKALFPGEIILAQSILFVFFFSNYLEETNKQTN